MMFVEKEKKPKPSLRISNKPQVRSEGHVILKWP